MRTNPSGICFEQRVRDFSYDMEGHTGFVHEIGSEPFPSMSKTSEAAVFRACIPCVLFTAASYASHKISPFWQRESSIRLSGMH